MKRTTINLTATIEERDRIKSKAKNFGFKNTADYIRYVCLNAELEVKLRINEGK